MRLGMKKHYRKMLFGSILLLSGLFVVITQFTRLEHFLELLRNIELRWIAFALLFELGTYFSLALVWKTSLDSVSHPCPMRTLVPLAVAKLFADQAIPTGGVSGIAFFVEALKKRGVPPPICMGTMLVHILSYYGAYLFVTAISVLLLWMNHEIHPWIVIVSTIFFIVAAAIPSTALFLKEAGARNFPKWVKRLPLVPGLLDVYAEAPEEMTRKPRLLAKATFFQAMIFVLDTGTLTVMLLALGHDVSWLTALPCFVMASVVATLSLIPLGLGSFEATCTGLLAMHGIPVEIALTATLLLRGVTLWLPMFPGLLLTRRALLR